MRKPTGWKGESRRHSLARKGIKTIIDDKHRLAVNNYVATGKMKVLDPEYEDHNIFRLYDDGKTEEGRKATYDIMMAILREDWDEVKELQAKYEKVGAWDTASDDAIWLLFNFIHGYNPIPNTRDPNIKDVQRVGFSMPEEIEPPSKDYGNPINLVKARYDFDAYAKREIEYGSSRAYDVASEHGQNYENVKNTEWFKGAVAKQIKNDFLADIIWNARKKEASGQRQHDVFTKHLLNIARKTIKMSDAGASIMGGMTKAEAREIIQRHGSKSDKKMMKEYDEIPEPKLESDGVFKVWAGRYSKVVHAKDHMDAMKKSGYKNVDQIDRIR